YRVEGGRLVEDGSVSFASYGLSGAALYNNTRISDTKAYMTNAAMREDVVWNPSTLQITGTIAFPELAARGGIDATVSFDRGARLRGNRLFHAVYWFDLTSYEMDDDSVIMVFETETDNFVKSLEAPCPALDFATDDGEGNLYFSTWV